MKRIGLILFMAAIPVACLAQTSQKPAAPSVPATKPHTASGTSTAPANLPPWIKLPAGIPVVAHGPVKAPVALRFEDIKIGTGPVGQAGKNWHVKYTVWRAADGVKFDSWEDHRRNIFGTDGKPELDADGKPKLADPEPMTFPQGVGGVIPGFDSGLEGMRIGGKRRLFVPWQMAYGTRGVPDRPGHPGFPPKSDLIFDVELVDVTEPPPPPAPPVRPVMPSGAPHPATPAQPAPSSAQPQPGVHAVPVTPPASAMPAPTTPAATPAPAGQAPATPAQPAKPQPK